MYLAGKLNNITPQNAVDPLMSWGVWGKSTNASHHWGRVHLGKGGDG